jgi:hypothetical protein
LRRWFLFGTGLLALIFFAYVRATPVVSQGLPNVPRYEYRVIEVLGDTRSIQTALDEYGHAGWELVAFEMGELQAPRLIFKKASGSAS